jgi:hypothetical protein
MGILLKGCMANILVDKSADISVLTEKVNQTS